MAWAVRCAQLNQRRGLVWCLAITLACAGFFLGVKAVEYSTQVERRLAVGRRLPTRDRSRCEIRIASLVRVIGSRGARDGSGCVRPVIGSPRNRFELRAFCWRRYGDRRDVFPGNWRRNRDHGRARATRHTPDIMRRRLMILARADASEVAVETANEPPRLAGVFFSIYYAMTGSACDSYPGGDGRDRVAAVSLGPRRLRFQLLRTS